MSENETHGIRVLKQECEASIKTQLQLSRKHLQMPVSWCVCACVRRCAVTPAGPERSPVKLAHPCCCEGRGLSCIGWGQIRSGTPGATEERVRWRVCLSEPEVSTEEPPGSQSSSLQATAITFCLITLHAVGTRRPKIGREQKKNPTQT